MLRMLRLYVEHFWSVAKLVFAGQDCLDLSICFAFGLRYLWSRVEKLLKLKIAEKLSSYLHEHKNCSEHHESREKVESWTWEIIIIFVNHAQKKALKSLPVPQEAFIMPKVFVIINTSVQLNMTAMADATPFTSDAKSSPIIICWNEF